MLLNLRETPEQKIYVSSDFHLNHDPKWPVPIWESRGFKSAKEMTDGIIDITNSMVRPNDILLFLGDWCLNTTVEVFESTLTRFHCQNIYALWGNHNNPHEKKVFYPNMPKERVRGIQVEKYPFEYKNIVFLPHYVEAILNGQYAILHHYPIYVWNEMAHGAWMLCGHSHNGCDLSKAESTTGKILDVGWDGHGKPWSLSEIAEVMKTKVFQAVDHHHPSIIAA